MKTKFSSKRGSCLKTFRALIIFSLYLIFSFESVAANVSILGQAKPVSIEVSRATSLHKVLSQLKDISGVKIFYSNDLTKKIECPELHIDNMPVDQALDLILEGTGLIFEEIEGALVIKAAQEPQKQIARRISVQGRITDKEGVPIPGVAIMVKGTRSGDVSNEDGFFSLLIRQAELPTLIFRMMGMKTIELDFDGTSFLNIVMEDDISQIKEAVVTGIFDRDINTFTGASVTIKEDEIKAFGNRNILETLRNIDPSFNIIENNQFGSNPNRLPEIQIRGSSSIPNVHELQDETRLALNTPLVILDGFQSTLQRLLDINENEVESITLLKDASATAIYGSRGANGVIVITTKAPEMGKLKINYRGDVNVEIPDLTSYDRLNAREKLELERMVGLYERDGVEATIRAQRYYSDILNEINSGVNTDWMALPLRAGVGQKHNLRIEGGDQSFRYLASAQINQVNGVMKESYRRVFNGSVKLTYTYDNIRFTNNLMVGVGNTSESPYGSFGEYVKLNPYWRVYDDNGALLKELGYYGNTDYGGVLGLSLTPNPLYNATVGSFNTGESLDVTNNTSIEWTIIPQLILRGRFGITKRVNENHDFKPADHTDFASYSNEEILRRGSYNLGHSNGFNYDASLNLSYSRLFKGNHHIYGGLDANFLQNQNITYLVKGEGFVNSYFSFFPMALSYDRNAKPSGSESYTRTAGFTGNFNYTYDNRYNVDFSARADGSSQFGADRRFTPFWSMGLGWIVSNESFLKEVDFINRLKVRGSLGTTGHQSFSSYQAFRTYQYITNDSYHQWLGANMMALGNPNLNWQMKMNYNIGIEATILNERVNLVVDFYQENVKDLVSSINIPLTHGFSSYIENIGKVENRGFEAKMTAFIFRNWNNLTWNISAAMIHNKNTIVEISEALKEAQEPLEMEASANPNILYKEGHSINSIWVVPSLGIDPATGREVYLKQDGTPTFAWSALDLQDMGLSQPKFQGNINSTLRYKDFSINLSFGYKFGGQLYNQTLINNVENADYKFNVDRRVYEGRWQQPGDEVPFKSLLITARTNKTSRFVQDERTFNLQNVSLRYDIKSDRAKKLLGAELITLSAHMADLFYLSTVKRERGLNYPFSRQISFSLGITF